jgi:hypothetical protein
MIVRNARCKDKESQVILFIVILKYIIRQHNNIIINVFLLHVSTQESHHQADYLRTVNTLYPLQYYTYVSFALGIPYALHCVIRKPGFYYLFR